MFSVYHCASRGCNQRKVFQRALCPTVKALKATFLNKPKILQSTYIIFNTKIKISASPKPGFEK